MLGDTVIRGPHPDLFPGDKDGGADKRGTVVHVEHGTLRYHPYQVKWEATGEVEWYYKCTTDRCELLVVEAAAGEVPSPNYPPPPLAQCVPVCPPICDRMVLSLFDLFSLHYFVFF